MNPDPAYLDNIEPARFKEAFHKLMEMHFPNLRDISEKHNWYLVLSAIYQKDFYYSRKLLLSLFIEHLDAMLLVLQGPAFPKDRTPILGLILDAPFVHAHLVSKYELSADVAGFVRSNQKVIVFDKDLYLKHKGFWIKDLGRKLLIWIRAIKLNVAPYELRRDLPNLSPQPYDFSIPVIHNLTSDLVRFVEYLELLKKRKGL